MGVYWERRNFSGSTRELEGGKAFERRGCTVGNMTGARTEGGRYIGMGQTDPNKGCAQRYWALGINGYCGG